MYKIPHMPCKSCRTASVHKKYFFPHPTAMNELLVIGAGPAGLTAAVYACRQAIAVTVCEAALPGGQMLRTGEIANAPGFTSVTGAELSTRLYEQAQRLGATFLSGAEEVWPARCEVRVGGSLRRADAMIFAAGARPTPLNIPGESALIGRGVSWCAACDGAFFRGKDAAVIGGGNTALSEALELAAQCRTVYLVHRRDAFRAEKALQDAVFAAKNIRCLFSTTATAIEGAQAVQALRVLTPDGAQTIPLAAVFPAIGAAPATQVLRGRAPVDGHGYLLADENGKTAIPGFFVAGDVRSKAVRQIVTACADGAAAAIAAGQYLRGSAD